MARTSATDREALLTEDSDASFDENGGVFPRVLGRPWAGGADSLHSMLYYDRYRRTFFKEHPLNDLMHPDQPFQGDILRCRVSIPGKLSESSFDISRIISHRESFLQNVNELLKIPIEPTHSSFTQWQSGIEPVAASGDLASYWITARNKCAKLEKLVYRILSLVVEQELTLQDVVSNFKPELMERLLEYIRGLEATGLIVLFDPYLSTAGTESCGDNAVSSEVIVAQ